MGYPIAGVSAKRNGSNVMDGEMIFKKYYTSGKTYSWRLCAAWYNDKVNRRPDGSRWTKAGVHAAAWRWAIENADEAKEIYSEFFRMWRDGLPLTEKEWFATILYKGMRYKNNFPSVRRWMKKFPEFYDEDIYNARNLQDAIRVWEEKYSEPNKQRPR